jgi:iron complex outermembrane receptor protein
MQKICIAVCMLCMGIPGMAQDSARNDKFSGSSEVIVTAGRLAQKRSEAPIAIATINEKTIRDTKAQRLDQLLNKVSGVYMVDLGNEQHQMSIRQPMTTKSLFLYMEDGIPIRTTGVYNHNAMLEMNQAAIRSIEVIKGPSSALYGAEAIAGAVNIITPTAGNTGGGYLSLQLNNNGYRRADMQASATTGNWGIIASGYYAGRNNGSIDFSDFHKTAFTLRTDYNAGKKISWTNAATYVDYYSDMTGTLDSAKFADRNYTTPHTFTYRSVQAFRLRSSLNFTWTSNSQTQFTVLYRNNTIGQNPSYSVASTANPLLYKGQINRNSFASYMALAQHVQQFDWIQSRILAGVSVDNSPQSYNARFIWINRESPAGKFTSYNTTDSLLQNFSTGITNMAGYINYDIVPLKNLRLVAALRYDVFHYDFTNKLDTAKTTVAASTTDQHYRVTPKLGLTWNHNGLGFYANYSEGYVPPQLTELYTSGSKTAPLLLPQTFRNYEIGGWISLQDKKLYADWSVYLLQGNNEISSVRQADNSNLNQNAGKTRHTGIEYGINWRATNEIALRLSGTNAKHVFVENVVRGVNYNGKEMSAAPRFIANAEISYQPAFMIGFRISAEWQHVGSYYMDDLNRFRYPGFDVLNLRTAYKTGRLEFWCNLLNATDTYFATIATKNATTSGNASYAYQLGDPRELTIGIALHLGKSASNN